jgi:anti-anti-sigma factor
MGTMDREEADPTADLRVRIEGNGYPVLRVFVGGEIDMSVSDALFDALAEAWSPNRTTEVQVDLSDVRLLDASGIRVLLAARNRAMSHGIAFRAFGAAGLPRRVLELCGVLDLLGGKE